MTQIQENIRARAGLLFRLAKSNKTNLVMRARGGQMKSCKTNLAKGLLPIRARSLKRACEYDYECKVFQNKHTGDMRLIVNY